VRKAGVILQIELSDLGRAKHPVRRLSLADFKKKALLHIEVLNHALSGNSVQQLPQ